MKEFINKIKNKEIREATQLAVDNLPAYFYEVASSSSGKYHPSFSQGKMGLVRHSTFAVEIAIELFNIYTFTNIEKDIIISSLLLHDGLKYGNPKKPHTTKEHPRDMAIFLSELWKDVMDDNLQQVINGIHAHSGKWNKTNGVDMPVPKTKVEKMVHLADYLSSRKVYDKYYNIEK